MAGKTLPHCKDELYAENLHDECFFRNIAHFKISCGFRGASTCRENQLKCVPADIPPFAFIVITFEPTLGFKKVWAF